MVLVSVVLCGSITHARHALCLYKCCQLANYVQEIGVCDDWSSWKIIKYTMNPRAVLNE